MHHPLKPIIAAGHWTNRESATMPQPTTKKSTTHKLNHNTIVVCTVFRIVTDCNISTLLILRSTNQSKNNCQHLKEEFISSRCIMMTPQERITFKLAWVTNEIPIKPKIVLSFSASASTVQLGGNWNLDRSHDRDHMSTIAGFRKWPWMNVFDYIS